MVPEPAQHVGFPCTYRQPAWHDRVIREDIKGNPETQHSIARAINFLAGGRPHELLDLIPPVPQQVSWLQFLVHAGEITTQIPQHKTMRNSGRHM
jgi:hypothetical protein